MDGCLERGAKFSTSAGNSSGRFLSDWGSKGVLDTPFQQLDASIVYATRRLVVSLRAIGYSIRAECAELAVLLASSQRLLLVGTWGETSSSCDALFKVKVRPFRRVSAAPQMGYLSFCVGRKSSAEQAVVQESAHLCLGLCGQTNYLQRRGQIYSGGTQNNLGRNPKKLSRKREAMTARLFFFAFLTRIEPFGTFLLVGLRGQTFGRKRACQTLSSFIF